MTPDEVRALIAEGRKCLKAAVAAPCGIPAMTLPPCDLPWGHDGSAHANHGDGFAASGFAVEHARRQWMRTNLASLLTGYAEALAEVERLQPVVDASREMREAEHQLPGPPDTDVIAELEVYYANLKIQSVKAQTNTAKAILRWRSAVDQFMGTKP